MPIGLSLPCAFSIPACAPVHPRACQLAAPPCGLFHSRPDTMSLALASTVPELLPSHEAEWGSAMRKSSVAGCRVFQITSLELREESARAFRDFAGAQPGGSKRIACALRCSERTAQNYLDGLHTPSGIHDLRALHAIPHYAAMAKLADLVRFVQQHGEHVFGGDDG